MPKKTDVHVRIDRAAHKRFKLMAAQQGLSLKALLEMLSFAKTKKV